MSAEDFGLIETLLWTRDGGFHLLPEHLARLAASSAALGFAYDEARARAALEQAAATHLRAVVAAAATADAPPDFAAEPLHLRVRLVLSRDGALATSATEIEPVAPSTIWRVAFAQKRFDSRDAMLQYKTTRRALYEDELATAQARCGADEVLFLNERDEICESARCNLFLPKGDLLLTPRLTCGLLPGTQRARLLAEGRAREAVLHAVDIDGGFLLGNSVRGLVRAEILDEPKP